MKSKVANSLSHLKFSTLGPYGIGAVSVIFEGKIPHASDLSAEFGPRPRPQDPPASPDVEGAFEQRLDQISVDW